MSFESNGIDTSTKTATLSSFFREIGRARRAGWGNIFGYLFIAPALILYLVFSVWPIFRGLAMAFTDYRFIYPDTRWDFNGVSNFVQMANDEDFWEALVISLRYTVMVVPTRILLALLIAVLISNVRGGEGFYRWIVYLPTVLPIAVTFLMWREFYDERFGFINTNLRALGVENPPKWLGSTKFALPSVAAADVWRGFGFPTLLFLIGIYNINIDLYEAAAIDGASTWQQFWKITLPLLKPVFSVVLVLNSNILGATQQAMIMTEGGPQNATMTLGLYLYNVAFSWGDMRLGYSAAVSLVLGLLGAGLSLLWFRVLREEHS
jgi:multiple sugar transport system permease protein